MKRKFISITLVLLVFLSIFSYIIINNANAQQPMPLMQSSPLIKPNNNSSNACSTGKCPPASQVQNGCNTGMCPPIYAPPQNFNSQQPMQAQASKSDIQNILIILDASYSMEDKIGGSRKIDIAKRVIYDTVRQLPPNTRIGLRVYGHKIGLLGIYPCRKTELLVPIAFNTSNAILSQISGIEPTGMTPITYSLKMAVENDFNGLDGPKRIVLVSDGNETCDGDPCQYAVSMVRNGIDIKLEVVGFALKEQAAINQLRCVALSTGGKFYTADTEAELAKSLRNTVQYKRDVQGVILYKK